MSWLIAQVYDRFMAGAERRHFGGWRAELLHGLQGRVLEIGAGTGVNLAHYPADLERLVLTEPDAHMRARLQGRLPARAEVVAAGAERLPFADGSFDAVVGTLVLCSVADPAAALAELRRVLRPDGQLVFLEHVAAADPGTRRLQTWAEPVWKRLAGNCHLTRATDEALVAAGFVCESLTREAMPGVVSLVGDTVRGRARVG